MTIAKTTIIIIIEEMIFLVFLLNFMTVPLQNHIILFTQK